MVLLNRTLFGFFFYLGISFSCVASGDIDSLLRQAEIVKSSDRPQFSGLMAELKNSFDKMEINQKYFYLYLSGYQSSYSGDVPQAFKHYEHVVQNSRDPQLRYLAAGAMVNLYAFTSEWEEGFQYIELIEKLENQVTNSSYRQQVIISKGVFYNEIEYFQLTIDSVERLFQEGVEGRHRCLALALKLHAQLYSGAVFDSNADFVDAIDYCTQLNEHMIASVIRNNFGWHLLETGDGSRTLKLIEPYLEEIEKTKYQLLITDAYAILAQGYRTAEDYQKAKAFAHRAVDDAENATKILAIVKSYKLLYELELRENNFKKASNYLKKFVDAERVRYSETNARKLAIESAKYQAKEQDNQIKLLNKQNQILKLESDLAEETAVFNRWLIALLISTMSVLVLWVYSVKRSQQKLKYLAEYDSLTEISNRAFFTQSAESILSYFANSKRTVCIILFDLDHFKKVNDTYGHLVGDEVLKMSANACLGSVRKIDIFGRIGGEEFAMILPGCELSHAVRIAEECRLKISEIDASAQGQKFQVTASFGVAESKTCGYSLKDLLSGADEAMYIAKRRGRNQVVTHTGD